MRESDEKKKKKTFVPNSVDYDVFRDPRFWYGTQPLCTKWTRATFRCFHGVATVALTPLISGGYFLTCGMFPWWE